MDLDDAEPEGWGAETALVWRRDDLVTEILVHDSDNRLLDHFAKGGPFPRLLPDNEDHQAAETLIARFIEFATSGVIVPACPTSKREL